MFSTSPYITADDFRRAIYAGDIFRLTATEATAALTTHVRALLEREFGAPLAAVHERFDYAGMKEKLGMLRAALATEARYVDALGAIASVAGAPAGFAFDPLRLRCVLPGNHLNKSSEISYAAHRDTWYGNPQCQINFWIPLQDVTEEQSFLFYPALFRALVPNTSRSFHYGDWMEKHGWQGSKADAPVAFPTTIENPAGGRAFRAKAGEIITFSAAHLHQTVRNCSGMTRFSLDFRAVHLADHARGLGAPNVDNGSTPEALRDYLFPMSAAA